MSGEVLFIGASMHSGLASFDAFHITCLDQPLHFYQFLNTSSDAEWIARRRNRVTASAIASCVGKNPYEPRESAIKKKTGQEKPFQGNRARKQVRSSSSLQEAPQQEGAALWVVRLVER